MIMDCHFNPKDLINKIQARPAIWDAEHPSYRDKKMRNKLWNEVVKELLDGERHYSKSEIRDFEQQLQTRWKGMRDYYLKNLKKPNKGKPYVYYHKLQFLNKNIRGVTECSIDFEHLHPVEKKSMKREFPDCSDDEEEEEEAYDVHKPNSSKQEEFAFADVDYRRDSTEDPDKMFLLSLLPHLKSVPDRARLNLKTDIMKLIQAAQVDD